METEFRGKHDEPAGKGLSSAGADLSSLFDTGRHWRSWKRLHTVCVTGLEQKLPGQEIKNRYSIQTRNINSYQNSFEMLIGDLKRWKKEKYRVVLLSGSRTRASRLAGDLREYELSAFCTDDPERRCSLERSW